MKFSEAKIMAEKCIKKPFIFMTREHKHMISSLIVNADLYELSKFKKVQSGSICPVCGKGKPYIQRLLVGDNDGNCIGTAYQVKCDFCDYAPDGESSATIDDALQNWEIAINRIRKAQVCAKDAEMNQKQRERVQQEREKNGE